MPDPDIDELEYNSANTPEKEYRYAAGDPVSDGEIASYLELYHRSSVDMFLLDYLGNNIIDGLSDAVTMQSLHADPEYSGIGRNVCRYAAGYLLKGARQLSIDNGLRAKV